ncbi:MAG TPA: glycosyltransferase family 4 protein [Polyangia bacterium]|jgi:glycosyltransferase involved in cell wall biosynthesis|nr:glycosyltransferase family 4 protein [Polyangia bacterium]
MHFILGANIRDSHTTGMGRQMYGLGDALTARGHGVEYFFDDDVGSRFGHKLARLEYPVRLAAALRRRPPANGERPIALLHEPIGWASALFARHRVRTIAMVHNCESKVWRLKRAQGPAIGDVIQPSSRLLWPATELSQAYLSLKSAEAVLCLSSEDRTYLVDELRIAPARVHRIDNGLEPVFMGLPPVASDSTRQLLFVGHWLPHKGTAILKSALEKLTARGVSATLTLAGTSSTESAILQELPPEWRATTEVIPRFEPDALIALYRRHQVFVLPSAWEGIPLSMLEAMACGLCPIVARVGGVPDVLEDGVTGRLVKSLDANALADALASALRDPEQTQRLARAAQQAAQGYGWSRVAEQVERAVAA